MEENESFVVTVEETTVEENTSFIKHLQVNLLSHCIFCLRKTSKQPSGTSKDAEPSLKVAPRANPSPHSSSQLFLQSFNRTWLYLQNKKSKGNRDFVDSLLESSKIGEKSTKFLELPTMCQGCGDEMENVYKLFVELRAQLDAIGRIMEESGNGGRYSWRADDFQRRLTASNLEKMVIDSTISLLSKPDDRNGDAQVNESNCEADNSPSKSQASNLSSDLLSSCLQVLLEETPSGSPRKSVAPQSSSSKKLSSKSKELASGSGNTSTFVKVPSADKVNTGGFVNEDDDWDDDDHVQVKLEPEDSMEVEYSEQADDECIDSKILIPTQPPAPSGSRDSTPVVAIKKEYSFLDPQQRNSTQLCDLCNKPIPLKDILDHVRDHVGEEYLTPCPNLECSHVYSNSLSLYRHLEENSWRCQESILNIEEVLESTKASNCQACGHKAANRQSLQNHLLCSHETLTKNFSCPIDGCSQQFTIRQSVELHIEQHVMRVDFNKQNCRECGMMIELNHMEKHLKGTHGAGELFKCSNCPFLFSSKELLIEHFFVHRHSGVLTCDMCRDGVNYSEYSSLREHYFSRHGIGRQYPCAECSHLSWSRRQWTEHKNEVHPSESGTEGQRKPKRGRPPRGKNEIILEVESGGGEALQQTSLLSDPLAGGRHVCDLCGKSFSRRHNLTIHKGTAHLGLRPHACDTCGETFAHKNVLQRHKLIHTGERPYACTICDQRFSRRDFLKVHVDAHEKKGAGFRSNGPTKQTRKKVEKADPLQIKTDPLQL